MDLFAEVAATCLANDAEDLLVLEVEIPDATTAGFGVGIVRVKLAIVMQSRHITIVVPDLNEALVFTATTKGIERLAANSAVCGTLKMLVGLLANTANEVRTLERGTGLELALTEHVVSFLRSQDWLTQKTVLMRICSPFVNFTIVCIFPQYHDTVNIMGLF